MTRAAILLEKHISKKYKFAAVLAKKKELLTIKIKEHGKIQLS